VQHARQVHGSEAELRGDRGLGGPQLDGDLALRLLSVAQQEIDQPLARAAARLRVELADQRLDARRQAGDHAPREARVAFDLLEGRPLWRRNYGDLEASPLLHTQKIFVGNTEGAFSCIVRTTGDQLWKYELPVNARHKGIRSSAAGIDTMVVFGAEDGFLYALNADRGTQVWRHNTGASIVGSPCIANGNVYIGNLSGTICGVDLRSGKPRWQFEAGADIYASPSCADNKVFIGTSGGIMYALDAMTGTLVWKTDLGSVINSSAVIAGDVLYVGTLKKMLFGLNIVDGTPVLKQEVPGRIKTSPTVARGRLFVATDEKLILSFRSATR